MLTIDMGSDEVRRELEKDDLPTAVGPTSRTIGFIADASMIDDRQGL